MPTPKTAVIDKRLQPSGSFDLIRLGRNFDGGYLVDRRDVLAATKLVSLGINDDWSFESDFLALNGVPLDAYDGTVSPVTYAKSALDALTSRSRSMKSPLHALRNYTSFFRGDRVHHRLMVGLAGVPGFVSMAEVVDACVSATDRPFFKIDIEGAEYRILDDLVAVSDRMAGLVIEFHDYDLHRDRIGEFATAINLPVAHVHCNNFGPITDQGMPLAIEVTFSSQPPMTAENPSLPHRLDQPNLRTVPDFSIRFA